MKTTNVSFYVATNTGELLPVAVTDIPVVADQEAIETLADHCENFKELVHCFTVYDIEDFSPNYTTYSFYDFIERYNCMIGSVKNALLEYVEEYKEIKKKIIEINAIKDELTGIEFKAVLKKESELIIRGVNIQWDAKQLASKYGLTDFWKMQLERVAYVER